MTYDCLIIYSQYNKTDFRDFRFENAGLTIGYFKSLKMSYFFKTVYFSHRLMVTPACVY